MKFIFLLAVYFAGFATAVYTMVPMPEQQGDFSYQEGDAGEFREKPAVETSEFAQTLNVGLHKCVDVGKAIVIRTFKVIKEKVEEREASEDHYSRAP